MKILKTILLLVWAVGGLICFQQGDITDGLLFTILMYLTPHMKKI